jgi:hypothetical protein
MTHDPATSSTLDEGTQMTTRLAGRSGGDQAFTLPFRLTQIGQAAAGLVFSIAPLVAVGAYATAIGFSGDDPLVYRLGGAATAGYVTAPLLAIAWRSGWRQIRIPAMATVTYTVGAFGASVWEYTTGARQPIIPFVIVAGALFSVVAAYWLLRDEAPPEDPGRKLSTSARAILALATLSAATFGLLPLLVPGLFAGWFGLVGTDTWVFRVAGAGCLGYATAGIASLMAQGYRQMRLQNFAAITFNALAAGSAWLALVGGGSGLLALVVAAAATFFAIALIWVDRTHAT